MRRLANVLALTLLAAGCDPGVRIGSPCAYDSECPVDLVCRGLRCRAQCLADRDCSGQETCISGGCVAISEMIDGGPPDARADLPDAPAPHDAPIDAPPDGGGCADCPISVSAGHAHTCVVMRSGAVYCWGDNDEGQLGNDSTADSATPVRVAAIDDAVIVATGHQRSCARTRIGAVRCWGRNEVPTFMGHFQLGDGSMSVRSPSPREVALGSSAQLLAGGFWASCATVPTGVMCWGMNLSGELGNGTTAPAPMARPVMVSSIGASSAIAVGDGPSCAITAGTLRCWGFNGHGGTGTPMPGPVLTPTEVSFMGEASPPSDMHDVEAGGAPDSDLSDHGGHVCATRMGGRLYCFGRNDRGQLGLGEAGFGRNSAALVIATGVRTVSAGGSHTCVLDQSGDARCWGDDTYGQLGIAPAGTMMVESVPATPVPGLGTVQQISCGTSHTCAITDDGVYCFGSDVSGQLGDGTAGGMRAEPMRVVGLPVF